ERDHHGPAAPAVIRGANRRDVGQHLLRIDAGLPRRAHGLATHPRVRSDRHDGLAVIVLQSPDDNGRGEAFVKRERGGVGRRRHGVRADHRPDVPALASAVHLHDAAGRRRDLDPYAIGHGPAYSLRPSAHSVNMCFIPPMDASETTFGDEAGKLPEDLRQQIAATLVEQADLITADTAAIFPYSGGEELDTVYCRQIGELLTQIFAVAARDGHLDSRASLSGDFHRLTNERPLPVERVFTFVYLTERR